MSLLLGPSGSCAPPACTAALCALCGSVQGCFCVWMHWARPHLSLQSHLQEEQPLVENQPQESPSRGHCRFLPELSAQEGSLSTGLHQPHCKGSSGPCQGVTTPGSCTGSGTQSKRFGKTPFPHIWLHLHAFP